MNSDAFMEYAFIVMVALIGIEIFVSYMKGKQFYRLNVLIADVSTGVIFALVGVVILLGALYVYDIIEKNYSLSALGYHFFPLTSPFQFSPSFVVNWHALGAWTFSVVLADFIYYWFHRHCHEINLFWATHVTHHSTQEMNLSVAFRGNGLQRIFEYMYFLVMALLGIPWAMFLLSHRILKVYQFVVHTRFIGKLGFLEEFMVTPSNHRVHHGTQRKYLDRNHGGIFIIWDRMFGSFEWETDEPIYGLTKPVNSFNPITVNLHVFKDMFFQIFKCKSIGDVFKTIFGPPGWKPNYLQTPDDVFKEPAYTEKYDPKPPMGVMVYVALQAAVLMAVGLVIWKVAKINLEQDMTMLGILSAVIIFSLFSIDRTMEMKRWSRRTEVVRNVLFIFAFVLTLLYSNIPNIAMFAIPLIGLSLVSLLWIIIKRKTFFDLSNISNTWY
ncbi:fatty acid hydroxylase family protein [Leptospira levettii]|uniref:Fatty acid hydroxylase family protein n=2 Tax=Leptospira levettii TaxID=2023178 RepID=A0ABY2MID2_9LEPT|nr:sterol desaturase family protein [Leptospira levettii]PKA22892.1 sterol desaturase [Leptospira sp. mixed culture ATI2-C-A1]MCW7495782.1 sterol desaturase family protein [Leptospira levettii]TGL67253.1 fatty acid hydroxylase family protein [Leptospira levettii]TGM28546.1 fatty acid hydroxylase family protein [Leptospira levettii]TGM32820.1 fatty acid hydroxylase family protein [Leptospira levettii]